MKKILMVLVLIVFVVGLVPVFAVTTAEAAKAVQQIQAQRTKATLQVLDFQKQQANKAKQVADYYKGTAPTKPIILPLTSSAVGDSFIADSQAKFQNLKIINNKLYISYTLNYADNNTTNDENVIKVFDGGNWQQIVNNNSFYGVFNDFSINAAGVIFAISDSPLPIQLKKFEAGNLVMPTINLFPESNTACLFGFDDSDGSLYTFSRKYIANLDADISFVKWDPNTGTSTNLPVDLEKLKYVSSGNADFHAQLFAHQGNVFIIYQLGDLVKTLKYTNGIGWQVLADLQGVPQLSSIKWAFDRSMGTPYFAFLAYPSPSTIKLQVMKLEGNSWTDVGVGIVHSGSSFNYGIAVSNGFSYLVFSDAQNKAKIAKYTNINNTWTIYDTEIAGVNAGVVFSNLQAAKPIVVDGSTLYVVFEDYANQGKARVYKFQ